MKPVYAGGRVGALLYAKEDIPAGTELKFDYGDRRKRVVEEEPWLIQT